MNANGRQLVAGGQARRELAQDGVVAEYLTFTLGDEHYGVDILRVQEIKGWVPVTRIPNAPEYLRGMLNLRGAIVPIVDLRMRFGLHSVEYKSTTVVIVLTIVGPQGKTLLGIVVDGVSDVLSVAPEEVKAAPDFGTVVSTEFIEGLATTDDGMVMLLDIDRLLNMRELEAIESLSQP